MVAELNQSINIEIKGHTYTLNYPNVGEFYNIEAMKQILGKGHYNSILSAPTTLAESASDMIEAESVLRILCPKFLEDLKVNSFGDLGLADFTEIRQEYRNKILPWFAEMTKVLSSTKE